MSMGPVDVDFDVSGHGMSLVLDKVSSNNMSNLFVHYDLQLENSLLQKQAYRTTAFFGYSYLWKFILFFG